MIKTWSIVRGISLFLPLFRWACQSVSSSFSVVHSSPHHSSPSFSLLPPGVQCRGGSDEYDDTDEDHFIETPSRPRPRPTSGNSHKKKNPSLLTSLAKQSLQLSGKVAMTTVQQSGKAAHYLLSPKHIEEDELQGVWRLDQQLETTGATSVANVELRPGGWVVVRYQDQEWKTRYHFTPRKWPRESLLEFEARAFLQEASKPRLYVYKARLERKLADPSVIKLVGKLYQLQKKWTGGYQTIPVGTFVGRRRLLTLDNDDEYHEDPEYDAEYDDYDEEEDDAEQQDSEAAEDYSDDVRTEYSY